MDIGAGFGAADLFGVGEELLLAALVELDVLGLRATARIAVGMRAEILVTATGTLPIEFNVAFDFARHGVSY
jgi:hypothetical protein